MKKCNNCKDLKNLSLFYKGKNYKDGYRSYCKVCTIKKKTEYYEKNRKRTIKIPKSQETIEKQRQAKNNYCKKYNKTRRSVDIQFKLTTGLRNRLGRALKSNFKSGSAVKDLGCSIDELKNYLESQFETGMTWDNYGLHGWHIDHILALSKFDLTNREEFLIAVHYTNLQPLWAKVNWSKGNN